jgi:hypothetical protein
MGDSNVNDFIYAIDEFSYFHNVVHIRGWAFCKTARLDSLHFKIKSQAPLKIHTFGLPSPDVEAAGWGPAARAVRFDEYLTLIGPPDEIAAGSLIAQLHDGRVIDVTSLGNPPPGGAHTIFSRFLQHLNERPHGAFLEIGSRARSGITRRGLVPPGWSYTGLDVHQGPNVDVVGDAHELSRILGDRRFDGVMAVAVLEHLLMPWKFMIELNKVMNIGGVGMFTTPQTWPMHDEPWDFFRFSKHSFHGFINKFTGFKIIDSGMGEPCFIVAERLHAATNFAPIPTGYLTSVVFFEKIGDTSLSWPVTTSDVIDTAYPEGEIAI